MKVVALKDLNLGGTGIVAVTKKKGEVFEISDTQPFGSKILFYTQLGTGQKLPLTLGTDINIVEDAQNDNLRAKKQGTFIFLGGALLLTYLIYKIIKS